MSTTALHARFLFRFALVASLLVAHPARAHIAAWHKGMYCLNGTGAENQNTNDAVNPLFNLTKSDWWFHHVNGCDEFPPADGDFLELPAGGSFTVEHAVNRAVTTLSYDGNFITDWPDGGDHPTLGVSDDGKSDEGCIVSPNIHTQNESMAAGTGFAISYTSSLAEVTPENLVVFSILKNTPWRRLATYQVPNLPACPDGGCICAWGWVANGCGEPNIYMEGFRCRVVGQTGSAKVATAVPPVWCEDNPANCVKGAKQMIYWNQLDGNNIEVDGLDLAGENRSPTFNTKLGFADGAQTDIFLEAGSASTTSIVPTGTSTSSGNPSATTSTKSGAQKVSLPAGMGWLAGLCVAWIVSAA